MPEDAPAPEGFREIPAVGENGFHSLCGPLWIREQDGKLLGGFRVEARHCNPGGICHGGMLSTFADIHLAVAAQFECRIQALILPTITLSIDFMAPTPRGAWLEARAEISKVTRSMLFAHETLTADGVPVAMARGIYRIPRLPDGVDPASLPNTGVRLREFLSL